jgi:hypothetical protein
MYLFKSCVNSEICYCSFVFQIYDCCTLCNILLCLVAKMSNDKFEILYHVSPGIACVDNCLDVKQFEFAKSVLINMLC